jgi:hypothetical protein
MPHAAILRYRLLVLAVAMLQLFSPLWGYVHAATRGGLTQEICNTAGLITVVLPDGASQDAPGDMAASHAQHCSVCSAGPALMPGPLAPVTPTDVPQGLLRVGHSSYQPCALAPVPPATGPPAAA